MLKKISLLSLCSVLFASMASCSGDDEPKPEIDYDNTSYMAVITAVDYRPAPGQFINELPEADENTTAAQINEVVRTMLNEGELISLGSLGGSVTMTLSRPIYNSATQRADFIVLGNAYITSVDNYVTYGSAEPGIVYVMEDTNGNGLPDDTWYALRGQDWDKVREVTVTYTVPEQPMADRWVDWTLSDGSGGHFDLHNTHNHSYFPLWEKTDTLTFTTLMIPRNGSYDADSGRYRQVCLWGYADSYPNNSDDAALSLDDAVDENGNPVHILKADFIKVVSAVLQSNGPMGECSTEVGGIKVLHD